MSCQRAQLLGCAVLALCILGVAVEAQPAPSTARAAVEQLTADLAAGKKISAADVKAFARKWSRVQDVMSVYKSARKGQPDMENVLLALSNQTTYTPAQRAQLTRIARLSQAQALLLPSYGEKTKGDVTRIMDWDRFTVGMSEGSSELLRALKKGEGRRISRAATNLAASCTDCHGAFRWWSSGDQTRPGKSSYEPAPRRR